jgi:hypothetical protein
MILQSKSDAAKSDAAKSDGALPALLTTGQVARKFKITLQTLHFYEEEGLVTPMRDNGRRIYDRASIARLAFVMEHRRLGMSLKKIAQLLAGSTLAVVLAPMLRFTH